MPSTTATRGAIIVPVNAFAICFGLAGLAMAWRLAADFLGAPAAVAAGITVLTLAVWTALLVAYLDRLRRGHTTIRQELTHPVTAPFVALIPITLIVLVPELVLWAPGLAAVVGAVAILTVILIGGWLTGTWLGSGVPEASLHSGYYLPTVAAGLISGTALAALGQRNLGIMAVGLGGICWLLLGSVINNRNMIVESLPAPLLPTMAIDVAPVVVAGNAWFALNDGQPDIAQLLLAGFAVLMVLVQIRLYVLVYRKLSFGLGFWAFTFSYCAVATYCLRWLATDPQGWSIGVSWLVVAVITALLAWVTARSIGQLRSGTFFPRGLS